MATRTCGATTCLAYWGRHRQRSIRSMTLAVCACLLSPVVLHSQQQTADERTTTCAHAIIVDVAPRACAWSDGLTFQLSQHTATSRRRRRCAALINCANPPAACVHARAHSAPIFSHLAACPRRAIVVGKCAARVCVCEAHQLVSTWRSCLRLINTNDLRICIMCQLLLCDAVDAVGGERTDQIYRTCHK